MQILTTILLDVQPGMGSSRQRSYTGAQENVT